MAKPDTRSLGSPQSWARTPGTSIAAQAHIDGADQVARDNAETQMWETPVASRLAHPVPELREKFDRQRYLLNQAIWLRRPRGCPPGKLPHDCRMARALDKAATARELSLNCR